jgi:hypothetical protein
MDRVLPDFPNLAAVTLSQRVGYGGDVQARSILEDDEVLLRYPMQAFVKSFGSRREADGGGQEEASDRDPCL